jgi:hypothetical protein
MYLTMKRHTSVCCGYRHAFRKCFTRVGMLAISWKGTVYKYRSNGDEVSCLLVPCLIYFACAARQTIIFHRLDIHKKDSLCRLFAHQAGRGCVVTAWEASNNRFCEITSARQESERRT